MEKALDARADHDIVGRAGDIYSLTDIIGENLAEVRFSLGLPVGEQTIVLPERAFQVPLPQIEPEAFSVNSGGGEVIADRREFQLLAFGRRRLLPGNVRHIIAALGFGDDVSVRGKLQIGAFHRGSAEMEISGAGAQRRHPAARRKAAAQDQIPVIMINLKIQMFFVF